MGRTGAQDDGFGEGSERACARTNARGERRQRATARASGAVDATRERRIRAHLCGRRWSSSESSMYQAWSVLSSIGWGCVVERSTRREKRVSREVQSHRESPVPPSETVQSACFARRRTSARRCSSAVHATMMARGRRRTRVQGGLRGSNAGERNVRAPKATLRQLSMVMEIAQGFDGSEW